MDETKLNSTDIDDFHINTKIEKRHPYKIENLEDGSYTVVVLSMESTLTDAQLKQVPFVNDFQYYCFLYIVHILLDSP